MHGSVEDSKSHQRIDGNPIKIWTEFL